MAKASLGLKVKAYRNLKKRESEVTHTGIGEPDGITPDRRLSGIASKSHFPSKSIFALAQHNCRAFAFLR
jgi:hypothetical protein